MAAQKFLQNVSGKLKEVYAAVTSTANAIVAMDATGKLDISVMPNGVGAATLVCTAFEALSAGAFVNLFLDISVIKARNADATSNGKIAHGFVIAAVSSGASATVYFESTTNTGLSGLTIGSDYFLATTAGQITTTPPAATGNIVQFIGRAQSATAINFINSDTIEIA